MKLKELFEKQVPVPSLAEQYKLFGGKDSGASFDEFVAMQKFAKVAKPFEAVKGYENTTNK